jgi:hypothetical protein
MKRATAAMAFALAFAASAAWADEPAQWPPPAPVEARMHELQHVIGDPHATPGEREAARKELGDMLKSPAGQARGRTPDEKPVRARAAIEPLGPIVKPAQSPAIATPPVAHVEVISPPPASVAGHPNVAAPANGFAVDPRNGHVLHETINGYVDPRTGQFTPK